MQVSKSSKGFTIVELLIVIVIIGILAALVIVAYTGLQNRANDASVQSDLRGVSQKLEEFYFNNDRYPNSATEVNAFKFKLSKGAYQTTSLTNNVAYCYPSDGSIYALVAASKSGNRFYISSDVKTPTSTTQAIQQSGSVLCPAVQSLFNATPPTWYWLYGGGWTSAVA